MLEKVGFELTIPEPAEAGRLRQRAQLILDLLTPKGQSPIPSATGSDCPLWSGAVWPAAASSSVINVRGNRIGSASRNGDTFLTRSADGVSKPCRKYLRIRPQVTVMRRAEPNAIVACWQIRSRSGRGELVGRSR
jgi:hypothetical protein